MITIETVKSPGLVKPALIFVATAALLLLSSRAPAQELSVAPRAYAGPAAVRIRGVDASGMTAVAFAGWMFAHRKVEGARGAELFARADANRDGKVTAYELKDLLLKLA